MTYSFAEDLKLIRKSLRQVKIFEFHIHILYEHPAKLYGSIKIIMQNGF